MQLQPDFISAMLAAMQAHPRNGMAAAKLLLGTPADPPYRLDSTGLFIDRKRLQFLRGHGEIDQGQFDAPGEVFGVDGWVPLYRREMLEDIKINGEYFDGGLFCSQRRCRLVLAGASFGMEMRLYPSSSCFS